MRKILIVILAVGFFLASGYIGYRAYKTWKQRHAVKLAKEYIEKGDLTNGTLWLRKAIMANPRNVEATRMMADFAEIARAPGAVQWRARLVELDPSLTNRLLYARAAMAAGDAALATRVLSEVDAAGKTNSAYHKIAGVVALSAHRLDDAELHLTETARLEPTNGVARLNLAVLQLQRADPKISGEARKTIEQLAANPALRVDALRQLTLDAFRSNQTERALGFCQGLLRETNAAFSDRLLQLDILRAARSPKLQPTLGALQAEVATNAPGAYQVAKWMLASGSAQPAFAWLQSLSPAVRTNQPMPMLIAECQMAAKDWAGLSASLEKQDWAEVEFLRLAYRARALRSQNLEGAAKADFAKALKAADNQQERLSILLRATIDWQWAAERDEILWAVVNRYPGEKWAVQALAENLQNAGQTRSLLTLFAKAVNVDTNNVSLKNNLAALALLLNSPEHKPHDLARQVYQQAGTNAYFATTYAFSLYLQNKPAESLKVMEQMPPVVLENPSMAGYYGLSLKATGQGAKAAKYLQLATKGKLLPEEAALFRKAAATP